MFFTLLAMSEKSPFCGTACGGDQQTNVLSGAMPRKLSFAGSIAWAASIRASTAWSGYIARPSRRRASACSMAVRLFGKLLTWRISSTQAWGWLRYSSMLATINLKMMLNGLALNACRAAWLPLSTGCRRLAKSQSPYVWQRRKMSSSHLRRSKRSRYAGILCRKPVTLYAVLHSGQETEVFRCLWRQELCILVWPQFMVQNCKTSSCGVSVGSCEPPMDSRHKAHCSFPAIFEALGEDENSILSLYGARALAAAFEVRQLGLQEFGWGLNWIAVGIQFVVSFGCGRRGREWRSRTVCSRCWGRSRRWCQASGCWRWSRR